MVESAVGKGEIARYEQFLLFPQCFRKKLYCRHVKTRAWLGKGLNNKAKSFFPFVYARVGGGRFKEIIKSN